MVPPPLSLFAYFSEGAEAGHLPRNRFVATLTLAGSRGKVVVLEKLRISSPDLKKFQGGEHRSSRLAAIFLLRRRARPEERFFSGTSQLFLEKNVNFWFAWTLSFFL